MSDYIKRGNLMWEGSRMMLPEHVQALRKQKRRAQEEELIPPREEEKKEFAECASQSLRYSIEVEALYWKNGVYQKMYGIVSDIHSSAEEIKLNGEWLDVNRMKRLILT